MQKPLIIGKEKIFDYKIEKIENVEIGIICPSLNLKLIPFYEIEKTSLFENEIIKESIVELDECYVYCKDSFNINYARNFFQHHGVFSKKFKSFCEQIKKEFIYES